MSLDGRQRSHDIQDMPASSMIVAKGGAATLMPYENTIIIQPDLGAVTIELCAPCEAAGRIVSLSLPDADTAAAGGSTVATRVAEGLADAAIDADGDHELLYSDGRRWIRLVNGIA